MSDTSHIIRLLDATGTKVLDTISTQYEDAFCLESFGDLIKAANEAPGGPKRFIIARVQTWDAKQPDKAFYSYYHAYHLNKILFQTQTHHEKKLIHRLHVLNPLTNTDIIGHVLYFMVKENAPKAEAKLEVVSLNDSKEPPSPRSLKGPSLKVSITHSKSFPPPSPSVNKDLQGTDTLKLNHTVHNGDVDEKKDKKDDWTVASTSTGVAEQGEEIPTTQKIETITQQDNLEKLHKISPKQVPLDFSEIESITNVRTRHGAPLETSGKIKIESKNETASRRHSLSYASSISASTDPNKEMVRTDHPTISNNPFQRTEMVSHSPDEVEEPGEEEVEFYDAIFIGTDADFLKSSRIRRLFSENAASPNDVAFFQMPSNTRHHQLPPPLPPLPPLPPIPPTPLVPSEPPSPRRDTMIQSIRSTVVELPTFIPVHVSPRYRRFWYKYKHYLVNGFAAGISLLIVFIVVRLRNSRGREESGE